MIGVGKLVLCQECIRQAGGTGARFDGKFRFPLFAAPSGYDGVRTGRPREIGVSRVSHSVHVKRRDFYERRGFLRMFAPFLPLHRGGRSSIYQFGGAEVGSDDYYLLGLADSAGGLAAVLSNDGLHPNLVGYPADGGTGYQAGCRPKEMKALVERTASVAFIAGRWLP